jgi:glycopeptide antibiotics resistance protein
VLLYGVFAIYILLLLLILFRTKHLTRSVNLIPFRGIFSFLTGVDLVSGKDSSILLHTFALSNLLSNILIFVPLGIYTTLFNSDKRIFKNALLIIAISISVEVIQFVCKLGIGDIDDVILNGIGGLIGIVICRLLYLMFKDDIKVRCIIAIIAPIGGVLSLGMLIFYNSRF